MIKEMKHITISCLLALMPIFVFSQGIIKRPVRKSQQTTVSQNSKPKPKPQTKEWVDLGLSVKWATCNIGAHSPSDYGSYFAWGETASKSSFVVKNCKNEGKVVSDFSGNSKYDAARVIWGGKWRVPTKSECEELVKNCEWTWTTQGGHKGFRVTSKINGNSIFLPATGSRINTMTGGVGENGGYWTSTPENEHDYPGYGYYLATSGPDIFFVRGDSRYRGYTVRPVTD